MSLAELVIIACLLCLALAVASLVFSGFERRVTPSRSRHQASPPTVAVNHATPRPNVSLGPSRPVRLDAEQVRLLTNREPVIHRGRQLAIRTRTEPLWKEKGWHRGGVGYEGFYRTGSQSWRGLIQEPYPGRYQAFIWNPPLTELDRQTNHRACFQNGRLDGRYQVHYHTAPQSLDHAICSIEDVLSEACGATHRR